MICSEAAFTLGKLAIERMPHSPPSEALPFNADVPILAEGRAPRVLHFPIFGAVVGAIANHQHAMVKLLATSAVSQDATCVVLEDGLICFDGDRDWLLHDGSLKGSLCRGDIGVSSDIASLQSLGA